MTTAHTLNVALHVLSGAVAMAVGFMVLWRRKGGTQHAALGTRFVGATVLVCLFAAVGLVAFRFLPAFAVTTVLVLYQLLTGWHVIYTRHCGPDRLDAACTLGALIALVLLAPSVAPLAATQGVVVYSTAGALCALLVYDTAKWLIPRSWHAMLWPYEHVYKMMGSLFGMLSVFVGNVVRIGQPWSQMLPSVVGFGVVMYFFIALAWRRFVFSNRRSELAAQAHS